MGVVINAKEHGMPDKKPSEVAALIDQIRKDKGEKTIIAGNQIPDIERIPTGIFEVDFALGGGFPRGKISMIEGMESSCKSNIAQLVCGSVQSQAREDSKAVWVDLEHSYDPKWAVNFGIDNESIYVVKPGYGEEAVDIVDALVRASDVGVVVIDSLATLVASKEIQQSAEKFDVGTSSILIKRMVNKVIIALAEEAKRGHYPAVIMINQIRFKIGVIMGDPTTTPGGKAKDFLSSLTLRLSGSNKMDKDAAVEIPAIKEIKARIKKAKIGVLQSVFEFDMYLQNIGDIKIGQSDSWNMVKGHLQQGGILRKPEKGTGWLLWDEKFDTLIPIANRYTSDTEFRVKLQQAVVSLYNGQKVLIETEQENDKSLSEAGGGT